MESNETVKKSKKKKQPVKRKTAEAVIIEKPERKEKSFLSSLITVIIACLIVGGSVYAWQRTNGEKKINQVKQETDSVKIDFENRLSSLKEKLSGIESEYDSLKSTNEDLKEKADLLAEAKIEYANPELGVSFEYPASFGAVKATIYDGITGKAFRGEFSGNSKLYFGGATADYSGTASGTEADFIDTLGYVKKKGSYYYQYAAGKDKTVEYKINPASIAETKNGEALIVDKKSFADVQGKPQINIGENIGAIVNIKKGGFTGMAIVNQDLGIFPLIDFGTMLESIDVN